MNIITVFNDNPNKNLEHNFYCRDFMSWDIYNYLDIKPKFYYLTISNTNKNSHYFIDAYKRFYNKKEEPDFTFLSIEELKEDYSILENSIVYFYAIPFLIKNNIKPKSLILVDDVLYEKSYVSNEYETFEEYNNYINSIPDITIYISNRTFCNDLKQSQIDGKLKNCINFQHLPVKFDFNRIEGITTNNTKNVIAGLENTIGFNEIINLIKNKNINFDLLGIHSTLGTEGYSFFLQKLLNDPSYFNNFKKIKHRINKYDLKNIQNYDIFYFYKYETCSYNFAIRSVWEFLYLGKGVHFKRDDLRSTYEEGDGVTYYLEILSRTKGVPLNSLFNKTFYAEKQHIIDIFEMKNDYELFQYFR